MNKQEALRYVEMRLEQDVPRGAIIEGLAAELHAPRAPIEKFVAQAEADFRSRRAAATPPPPPPPAPTPAAPAVQLPPWLQEMDTSAAGGPATPGWMQAKAPPASTAPEVPAWMQRFDPQAGGSFAKAMEAEAATQASPNVPSPKFDDPQLSKLVLKQLIAGRKRSDIAMLVCERTGTDWPSAQRFVAQVATENHTKINARKNILIIPIGLLFIVGGLGMALYGGLLFANLASGQNSMAFSAYNAGRQAQAAIGALIFGIALAAGGAIGIFLAVRSQTE